MRIKSNMFFALLIAAFVWGSPAHARRDPEAARLEQASGQIIAYGSAIEQAISRLMVMGICSDTQISFDDGTCNGYCNMLAPGNKTCDVFNPAGGGVTMQNTPPAFADDSYAGYSYVHGGGKVLAGIGSDRGDDIYLRTGMSSTDLNFSFFSRVCQTVNADQGVSAAPRNPGAAPSLGGGLGFADTPFAGLYVSNPQIVAQGDPPVIPPSASAFCLWQPEASSLYIFYVLYRR